VDKTITKFRWFWTWNDDAEAAWLGKMSAKGLHLASPGFMGFYKFLGGEPRDYIYHLDNLTFNNSDRNVSVKFFRGLGWEYLGQMGAWQYYRKDAKKNAKDIFADRASRVMMYRRMMLVTGMLFFALALILWSRLETMGAAAETSAATWIITALVLFCAYAVIRLLIRIKQVGKKRPGESGKDTITK
jgi:hypothetical protein